MRISFVWRDIFGCLQDFLNVDLACSSTGVIYILSSFQGVHFTRCSGSTEALLEESSVGQNLLSGLKAPALIFKLASGTLPACLGSEELLLEMSPGPTLQMVIRGRPTWMTGATSSLYR